MSGKLARRGELLWHLRVFILKRNYNTSVDGEVEREGTTRANNLRKDGNTTLTIVTSSRSDDIRIETFA